MPERVSKEERIVSLAIEKARKAKEEFIKNRIKQRTKPPLPNTMIRNSTSASQIKPSHHKSDNMRQFTNNSFNQNSNDDLLDDLI